MQETLVRLAAGRAATTALLRQVADRLDALDEPAAAEAAIELEHAVGMLADVAHRVLGVTDAERLGAWRSARPIGLMPAR
jgi:hypothetical protein